MPCGVHNEACPLHKAWTRLGNPLSAILRRLIIAIDKITIDKSTLHVTNMKDHIFSCDHWISN